ncbi:MAG: sigma-70 family RNA polymerase sigma factor [Actinomycetota bacterium]|nr:sigma-70 family RNA polymerase sigma factor [Actinomycetota bacterium]
MSAVASVGVIGRARSAVRSDEALLERIGRGEAASFEAFYRRYHAAVLGYCLARLGDRQAAEDATQEVFLKVHGAAKAPIESGKAWLFTIARNVVIDVARRRRSAPAMVDIETAVETAASDFDETAFSALDVTTNVFIALRRMPTRDRKAIVLRDFQDQSSAQIAEEFGMKPASVDVLLCRARAAFGRAYTEVSEMPFACRQATELIYRESGSGITDRQQSAMQAHLASCPRCEAEYARAHSPRFLAGLLPWLGLRLNMTGLTSALDRLRAGSISTFSGMGLVPAEGLSATAKAVVGAAITVAVLVPGVALRTTTAPVGEFHSALGATGIAQPASGTAVAGTSAASAPAPATGISHDVASAQEPDHASTSTQPHAKAMIPDGHDAASAGATHIARTHTVTDTAAHTTAPTGSSASAVTTTTDPHTGTTTTDTRTPVDEPHE